MRTALLCVSVLSLCCPAAQAQTAAEKIDWLKKNTHELRSVAASKEDDYSDLFLLDKALKGVRVVAIGEAAHGDGTTLQMKARLVRFLHERMGFDVLAFESNIFDVRIMDAALRDPAQTPLAAARSGVFGVWSTTRELQPFWNYLRETQAGPRPLEVAGFDVRYSGAGGGGRAALTHYLRDFFSRAGQTKGDELSWDRFEKAVAAQLEPMVGAAYSNPFYDEAFVKSLLTRVDSARAQFRRVWSDREIEFARQQLVNVGYLERYIHEELVARRAPTAFTRDAAMGLNLLWLIEKRYPDRKIVVWAATAHIQNDSGPNESAFSAVKRALGAQAYSLVFLSSEGSTGFVHQPREPKDSPASIPEPGVGSLAALSRDTGRSLFFLDFTALPPDHWLRQPIEASFRQHGRIFSTAQEMVHVWPERHDGMIYIRKMEPCISLPKGDSVSGKQ